MLVAVSHLVDRRAILHGLMPNVLWVTGVPQGLLVVLDLTQVLAHRSPHSGAGVVPDSGVASSQCCTPHAGRALPHYVQARAAAQELGVAAMHMAGARGVDPP